MSSSAEHTQNSSHHRLTMAGLMITLGIIYGDIGTSPLYVMRAVVGDDPVRAATILGAVSLVFWTLTIQTQCAPEPSSSSRRWYTGPCRGWSMT